MKRSRGSRQRCLRAGLQHLEVDGVLVEIEDVDLPGQMVGLLPVALEHDHPRADVGLDEDAALGDHGRRPLGLAVVVDEDARQLARPAALAEIDGDPVGDRVELPVAQEEGGVFRFDQPPEVAVLAGGQRAGNRG